MCAWDKSQPQDTTKLRRLGIVTRPNWEAIESADATFLPQALNLADRNAAGVPADPTAIPKSVILYSKQDGAGKPQLYSIDPDSNIFAFTGNKVTEGVNGGTAGGTLIKTEINIQGGRYVTYSGQTTAAVGSGTITFPENFTVFHTAIATAAIGIPVEVSIVGGVAGASIYRGVELTSVYWQVTGRIA